MKANILQRDFTEREQQHRKNQVGCQKRKAADPLMGQRACNHGDRKHPIFYEFPHFGYRLWSVSDSETCLTGWEYTARMPR